MESLLLTLLALLGTHVDALTAAQPVHRVEVQQVRSRVSLAPTKKAPARTKPVTAPTTPIAQPPATPSPSPSVDVRAQIEQYVLEETNARRTQNGLSPLTSDSSAASIARAHSADMIANNYFSHTNLAGCNAGCRLTNAGYQWKSYGENIHWMSGYNFSARESAQKIVNDWMNSSGHRANILGSFTYSGVGIAIEGSKVYSTAVYTTK